MKLAIPPRLPAGDRRIDEMEAEGGGFNAEIRVTAAKQSWSTKTAPFVMPEKSTLWPGADRAGRRRCRREPTITNSAPSATALREGGRRPAPVFRDPSVGLGRRTVVDRHLMPLSDQMPGHREPRLPSQEMPLSP